MRFSILNAELINTGGGCMVLFAEIWLPLEGRAVYSATSAELSSIYATKDESLECYPETEISERWFDEPSGNGDEFEEIHKRLFKAYDALSGYDEEEEE